jgi:hypothetical protein
VFSSPLEKEFVWFTTQDWQRVESYGTPVAVSAPL